MYLNVWMRFIPAVPLNGDAPADRPASWFWSSVVVLLTSVLRTVFCVFLLTAGCRRCFCLLPTVC
jgi:hypothetical protein